ncbi:hypothetical protein ACHAWU_002106 [Discostella pseudostelligera]|uniref:PH domain-containing protein n=1 Tax=Discostella pseudostelligera TaxID=259834 RepID=A0ABD3MD22_9STRA
MHRQESHRIYLQTFAPRSAHPKSGAASSDGATLTLHRHDSHDIHPPEYPTIDNTNPYRYNSSSDSSLSSYSFSSSFSSAHTRHGSRGNQSHKSTSHDSHTSQYKKFVSYPATVTTAAIVRLTDKAKTKDVTPLLRGKFGLPRIFNDDNQSATSVYPMTTENQLNSIQARISNITLNDGDNNNNAHIDGNYTPSNSTPESTKSKSGYHDEIDTLVLVGTCERPPKGYVRFEHEEYLEEKLRHDKFRRHYMYMEQHYRGQGGVFGEDTDGEAPLIRSMESRRTIMAKLPHDHIPFSESTATVKASGGKPGWTSSMLLVNDDTLMRTSISESSSVIPSLSSGSNTMMNSTSNSAVGLDLSSSRGSSAWGSGTAAGGGERVSTWSTIGVEGGAAQDRENLDISSPTVSTQVSSRPYNEYDLEPIHIVRTLLPEEQPLQVRDEMLVQLMHLREKAEDEMGFHLVGGDKGDVELLRPPPTFRWYFQPCSPLGGIGMSASSPKVQCIPAYIDVDGYCTEYDSDSEHDEVDDDSHETPMSSAMHQLVEERRRIHIMRELTDPPFLVSGYLLKQSRRDPNVWRRVYCVLSQDRLWTIRRMKPLKKSDNISSSDDILSSLRVGRNQYITLHRSLLLEREEGAELTRQYSSSRCSGYYLSPLNHRLQNSFRVITAQGQSHTFRAFTSQSFRVWVSSLSEKIAHMHGDGMMDLANVIAEEEILARRRRVNGIAVLPLHCNATVM